MPLDTRIALGYQAPDIKYEDAEARAGKQLQLRHLLQQEKLGEQNIAENDAQLKARQRADEDLTSVKQIFADTAGDGRAEGTKKTLAALLKGGHVQQASILQRQLVESEKADIENKINKTKLNISQAERLGMISQGVKSAEQYAGAIQQAVNEGILDQKAAEQMLARPYSQEEVDQFTSRAFAAKDWHTAKLADAEAVLKAGKDKRDIADHDATLPGKKADASVKVIEAGQKATLGMTKVERERLDSEAAGRKQASDLTREGHSVTMRGQNMTDSRSREMAEITRENKPPSSSEHRAGGFWNRANDAEKVLVSMEDVMAKKGWFGQGYYKIAPDFMQTEENKGYAQPQRAFIEAVLRKDSGASIPPNEFESLSKTYFPQPGDSPKLLAQKRRSRETQLKSLRIEAGRALKMYGEDPGESAPMKPAPVNLKDLSDDELMKRFNQK